MVSMRYPHGVGLFGILIGLKVSSIITTIIACHSVGDRLPN